MCTFFHYVSVYSLKANLVRFLQSDKYVIVVKSFYYKYFPPSFIYPSNTNGAFNMIHIYFIKVMSEILKIKDNFENTGTILLRRYFSGQISSKCVKSIFE